MKKQIRILLLVSSLVLLIIIALSLYYGQLKNTIVRLNAQERSLQKTLQTTMRERDIALSEATDLKNQDQYLINQKLAEETKNIQTTYRSAVTAYEELLKVKELTKKTDALDAGFADVLTLLSKRNYASAEAELANLKKDLAQTRAKLAEADIAQNVPVINAAPTSGYKRQNVQTGAGTFLVDIIAADLNSARVIVDTASDGDCADNCPVLSLADYAQRNGAFAAINGPYFCPAAYPSCAGKTNSFDTLLMNKNKVYFNSANNVYSVVPAVIFQNNSARFIGASQEWGRDTGVDAVIANQPLLTLNGEVVFYGDAEAKRASRGGRSFIGAAGSTVYIGVVRNATVAEAAQVVKTMGIANALNLDDGGSTALWSGGRYVVGPGRNLPFGILLVRK